MYKVSKKVISDFFLSFGAQKNQNNFSEYTLNGILPNSELHQFDYSLITGYNQATSSYQVILESESNKNLNIRALNGNIIFQLNNINLLAGEKKIITLDNAIFQNSNETMFLLQAQSSEGYIHNSVILYNH